MLYRAYTFKIAINLNIKAKTRSRHRVGNPRRIEPDEGLQSKWGDIFWKHLTRLGELMMETVDMDVIVLACV